MDTYSPNLVNFGLLFREQKFSTVESLHVLCWSATKFGSIKDVGVWHVLRESDELCSTFWGALIFENCGI